VTTSVHGVTACGLVRSAAERAEHLAVRHAVFVVEQGIFVGSDRDDRDGHPSTLHVLGRVDGVPAGAVRLYPLDPAHPEGDWQGDRLAVLAGYRASGLGRPLVRFAVGTAGAFGGTRMIAHIQPANRTFFRALGWSASGGPELYVGHPHLPMHIALLPPSG
jgi:putative N-acetyltransferase (TIGR04045 family)